MTIKIKERGPCIVCGLKLSDSNKGDAHRYHSPEAVEEARRRKRREEVDRRTLVALEQFKRVS